MIDPLPFVQGCTSLFSPNLFLLSCLQLEELKKTRGPTVEDGSVVRDKTLAAILAENKEKKEEEFQNVWKSMKQGDFVPLALPAATLNPKS